MADRSTGGCAGWNRAFPLAKSFARWEPRVFKIVGYHIFRQGERVGVQRHGSLGASAGAADLEVNCDTGEFRILRFAVIADAGKTLHHLSAKAQVDGGAVMGFGHALFEEAFIKTANCKTAILFNTGCR